MARLSIDDWNSVLVEFAIILMLLACQFEALLTIWPPSHYSMSSGEVWCDFWYVCEYFILHLHLVLWCYSNGIFDFVFIFTGQWAWFRQRWIAVGVLCTAQVVDWRWLVTEHCKVFIFRLYCPIKHFFLFLTCYFIYLVLQTGYVKLNRKLWQWRIWMWVCKVETFMVCYAFHLEVGCASQYGWGSDTVLLFRIWNKALLS